MQWRQQHRRDWNVCLCGGRPEGGLARLVGSGGGGGSGSVIMAAMQAAAGGMGASGAPERDLALIARGALHCVENLFRYWSPKFGRLPGIGWSGRCQQVQVHGEFVLLVTIAAKDRIRGSLYSSAFYERSVCGPCPTTLAALALRHVDRLTCFASNYDALIKHLSLDTAGGDGR